MCSCAGTSGVSSSSNSKGKYIFYLHGSVEESEGSTYKYETAVSAISDSSDNVISEIRGDTDPNSYAEKLKKEILKLISSGIPPQNITISGFSKGAIIALATSTKVKNNKINYVLLAGCSEYLNEKYGVDPSVASGRILSIYDSGDEKFGSCSKMITISSKVIFEEIELDSGKGHKLFRIPKEKFIEQWRDPLVEWSNG